MYLWLMRLSHNGKFNGAGSLFFRSRFREVVVVPEEVPLRVAIRLFGPFIPERLALVLMARVALWKSTDRADGIRFLLRELRALVQGGDELALPALFANVYRDIGKDPVLGRIRTANPMAWGRQNPMQAHYFYSLPENGGADKPPILFLHGFGGNFLFYLWAMRIGFPERAIIFPSWGFQWDLGPLSDRMEPR